MIGNERFDLMDVRIHEDWKFNKDKFDADIAVVTLFNPTTAQPICVPPHNSGNLIRPNGVVVRILLFQLITRNHKQVILNALGRHQWR